MKTFKEILLITIYSFCLLYLFGSFWNANLNINCWSVLSRIISASIATTITFIGSIFVVLYNHLTS